MLSFKHAAVILIAAGMLAFATPSFAYPSAASNDAGGFANHVEQIGWRCGPGWHANRWGHCVPNRARAKKVCPRGWHLNRRGTCVRNRPAKVCPRGFHLNHRGVCIRNR